MLNSLTTQGQKELVQDAKDKIIDILSDGFEQEYSELHNEAFNTDYYVETQADARELLDDFDVYKAIGLVYTYEMDVFGELYTDLSEPKKIANMLFYVIGDELLNSLETVSKYWNDEATDEKNAEIIKELEGE